MFNVSANADFFFGTDASQVKPLSPLSYNPRLVWSPWLWLAGLATIHDPSKDHGAKLTSAEKLQIVIVTLNWLELPGGRNT